MRIGESGVMQQRGAALGGSINCYNEWLQDLIGKQAQSSTGMPCILKLYDDQKNKHKLLDIVSFYGILEFNAHSDDKKKDDD